MEVNMQSPTKNEELSVALSEAGGAQRPGDEKLWSRKGAPPHQSVENVCSRSQGVFAIT